MKRLSKFLLPIVLATGCAGEAYLVDTSPPTARAEVAVYRPGYVWVNGHWNRHGNRWAWNDGYYIRDRPDYVYVQPRWEHRDRGYVYIQGGWRARGHVIGRRY